MSRRGTARRAPTFVRFSLKARSVFCTHLAGEAICLTYVKLPYSLLRFEISPEQMRSVTLPWALLEGICLTYVKLARLTF